MSANARLFSVGLVSAAAGVLLSSSAWAGGRPDDDSRNWFGHFSGGYAFAESDTRNILDDDWTLSGGALYWPSKSPVGLNLDLTYARFDVSSEAIQAINAAIAIDPSNSGRIDDGDVAMWALTANAIWGPGTAATGSISRPESVRTIWRERSRKRVWSITRRFAIPGIGGGAFQAASARARSSRAEIPRRSSVGTSGSATASRLAMGRCSSKRNIRSSTPTARTSPTFRSRSGTDGSVMRIRASVHESSQPRSRR